MKLPVVEEAWPKCYRIASSRFPPVGLFDAVADPDELAAVFYLEGLTNPRLRQQAGELDLVAPLDRIAGPGTTPVMAAFTHYSGQGTRFSDGSFGIYYGAHSQETAIAETVHHAERQNRLLRTPPITLLHRVYVGTLNARPYYDLRGMQDTLPEVYDPASYSAGQALGGRLRRADAWGLLYDSVRHPGGQCVAALRPPALGPVQQARHLGYVWDGDKITDVQVLRSIGVPGRG